MCLGLSGPEIRDIFAEWNSGDLGSFLLEISIVVLGKIDPDTNQPLVDLVLDTAEQKGTGKWTAQDALDLGAPVPTLTAAVIARIISGAKEERVAASEVLRGPRKKFTGDKKQFIARLREAYKITVIGCYAQGFGQLRVASQEYKYDLKYEEIARIWKGGCIIRAKLLDPIRTAFKSQPDLKNLMWPLTSANCLTNRRGSLRRVVRTATDLGTPDSGIQQHAGLPRRLPLKTPSCQPPPGSTRLLRRAHLPPYRQGRNVSHGVGQVELSSPVSVVRVVRGVQIKSQASSMGEIKRFERAGAEHSFRVFNGSPRFLHATGHHAREPSFSPRLAAQAINRPLSERPLHLEGLDTLVPRKSRSGA